MFVNQTVFDAAPKYDALTPVERAAYGLLDKLEIPYRRAEHGAADTIEDCAAVEAVLGAQICKNLFLTNAQKSRFYLLLMPGRKKFKTKDLSKQIGSARLSFAGAEEMQKLLPGMGRRPVYVELPDAK